VVRSLQSEDDCTWFVKGWDAAVAAGHTPTEIPENYKHCNVIVPSSSQIDSTQKSVSTQPPTKTPPTKSPTAPSSTAPPTKAPASATPSPSTPASSSYSSSTVKFSAGSEECKFFVQGLRAGGPRSTNLVTPASIPPEFVDCQLPPMSPPETAAGTTASPTPAVTPAPQASSALNPAAETPTPAVETPTPAGETPTPAGETPTPAGETPTPAGKTPTPAAETPTPAAETPTPAVDDSPGSSVPRLSSSKMTTISTEAPSDAPAATPEECALFVQGYARALSHPDALPEIHVPAQFAKCHLPDRESATPSSSAATPSSSATTPSSSAAPATPSASPEVLEGKPAQLRAASPAQDKPPPAAQLPPVTSDDPDDEHTPLGFVRGPDVTPPTCGTDGMQHPLGMRLKNAQTEAKAAQAAMLDRVMKHLPEAEGWECVDRAHTETHVEPLLAKLRRAMLSPPESDLRKFTVVFGGTSVTAGHDNHYNESYPFAFERMAKCAFQAAGIELVVRNAGLGFNQGLPYSLCVDEFYGRDADVVLWEMGPMGNDDPEGYEDEIAMRNFFSKDLFPRRPSFFFMGGGASAREIWGEVSPQCSSCHDHSGQTYYHGQLCPVEDCKHIPCKECPAIFKQKQHRVLSRAQSDLLSRYKDFGTGAINPVLCTGPLSDRWEFSASKLVRVAKSPTYDAGWHPGPYGHEMMGMIVAMKLLQHLQNVAGDIEGTKPENAVGSGARKWADNQIENLPRPPDDLPPPQVCAEEICGTPSHCATTLEPHVEQDHGMEISTIKLERDLPDLPDDGALVLNNGLPGQDHLLGFARMLAHFSDPVHDMRDYCSSYSDCPEELTQGGSFTFEKLREVMKRHMWVVGLMDFTRKAVDKQFGYHNGYRDRKFALMGVSSSDWLQLRFQGKTKSQILVLCEGPCPHNRCQDYRGRLNEDAQFMLDGLYLSKDVIHVPGSDPPSKHKDIFQEDTSHTCMRLDAGKPLDGLHYFGIRATSPTKILMLTNFIWW